MQTSTFGVVDNEEQVTRHLSLVTFCRVLVLMQGEHIVYHRLGPSEPFLMDLQLHAQAGAVTVRRTGGTDEREFLRRAAVLGIRVSPYFAAGGAYSDEDE